MVLRLQDLTPSSSDRVLTHYFVGNDMYSQFGHPRSEVRDLSSKVFRDAGLVFPIWRLRFGSICFGCGIPKMTYGIAGKFGTGRWEWIITQWGTPSLGLYPELWRHREKLARSFPDFDRENAKGLGWGTPWREQNIHVEKVCTTHIKENKNRQKKLKHEHCYNCFG